MSTRPRRIGLLTGGGDCPGLNAVIRAVAKSALHRGGFEVLGIEDGFQGLIEDRMRPLGDEAVSNILTLGGTILGTNNRCDPRRHFATRGAEPCDVSSRVVENVRRRGIDALIVIGGDGTMSVAAHFQRLGLPCIGVPKTIDNDLPGTDVTFGFATAASIASEALDRIHTTAESHHRAMIVEVMGRNAGWIALHAGIASGADVILLPEIPFDIAKVCAAVEERSRRGKRFSILCVSEGASPVGGAQVVSRVDPTSVDPIRLGGVGQRVAEAIESRTGIETRTTVLGHVQRGGTPVPADRVLATQFGSAAIELVARGGSGRLVVLRGGLIGDIDLAGVENKQRLVTRDHPLVAVARDVGTSMGD
ncbi:MAG: ATP-dependent 6-phosphofructokinase [Planctomycetota bacterium]|nr:ATP-dependent 6-phosphofructokinase [Planctomycetota bacterium]